MSSGFVIVLLLSFLISFMFFEIKLLFFIFEKNIFFSSKYDLLLDLINEPLSLTSFVSSNSASFLFISISYVSSVIYKKIYFLFFFIFSFSLCSSSIIFLFS